MGNNPGLEWVASICTARPGNSWIIEGVFAVSASKPAEAAAKNTYS